MRGKLLLAIPVLALVLALPMTVVRSAHDAPLDSPDVPSDAPCTRLAYQEAHRDPVAVAYDTTRTVQVPGDGCFDAWVNITGPLHAVIRVSTADHGERGGCDLATDVGWATCHAWGPASGRVALHVRASGAGILDTQLGYDTRPPGA